MSPALLDSPVAGAAALKSPSNEARDSLQQQLYQAFQQGQEFAKQQLKQEQVTDMFCQLIMPLVASLVIRLTA